MFFISVFGFILLIHESFGVCNLPPDFWCDHPKIAIECTGSLQYCDGYRAARAHQPINLRLSFESACPDSQQFITLRLYPQILSKPYLLNMVNFKGIPWGLAKREGESRVRCHHGERECIGNRLLSCAFLYYSNNPMKSGKLFNCFMSSMAYKPPPKRAITECLQHLQTPPEAQASILHCAQSSQADTLQRHDEVETRSVLSTPRFVPFISINGRSHIHMQAYQLFLGDKIPIWNRTLSTIAPTNSRASRCQLPPDFWCSDPSFTNECYNSAGCSAYERAAYGKPIKLKIIYDSSLKHSVDYILHYIKPHFSKDGRVTVEIEPTPISRCAASDPSCSDHAIQECVTNKINEPLERNKLFYCLLDAPSGGMKMAWAQKCHFLLKSFDPRLKDSVLNCANTNEWQNLASSRSQSHRIKLQPHPKQSDPWLIINDHSMQSAQAYQKILHQTICLWYRGPYHNRDACSRCEYEATHC
uniref:Uncharacterized protein n=1 Tax=Panagrolaimus superbus TaxID=310955 RepID=A0A914Y0F2_9BILA